MALWTSQEIAAATGGTAQTAFEATGVSIDTRSLQPGDLFVALTDQRDGHDFVAAALEKGAGGALVSRRPEGVPEDAPLIIVPEVLPALEALGRAGRARCSGHVIGITGSVGKTSVKEMMRTVFAAQGRTHAAEASYNNHWGVPLTLARMPADTEFAIIEIGMNAPGEIAPLAQMADLTGAMITTVAAAHLEAFESLEGIAEEKADIMTGLRPGAPVVLPGDISTAGVLMDRARNGGYPIALFGETSPDWRLVEVRLSKGQTIVQARHDRQSFLFKLSTAGRHFASNALGVLAVVHGAGADLDLACMDLARWVPPKGRGTSERVVLETAEAEVAFTLLDDAFNANPTSMAAAFEVLASTDPVHDIGRVMRGRRIAVLGDMLELGSEEMSLHKGLAGNVDLLTADVIHCVGARMKTLFDALPDEKRGRWTETAESLAAQAHQLVDGGDVVLVKGSKGSAVSRVVDALRKLGHPGGN